MKSARPWTAPVDFTAEHRLITRLLELRRLRRINVVFIDAGVYYVADSNDDPWGTWRRFTLEQLGAFMDELEVPSPFGPGRAGAESEIEARRRLA